MENSLRIFQNRWFERFARKEGLRNEELREAIGRAEKGLIDADLGSGLIKQRVARSGRGRRGGFRTIIAWRIADRAILLFGFAKKDRSNTGADDLMDLRSAARELLQFSIEDIERALRSGALMEIDNEEDISK